MAELTAAHANLLPDNPQSGNASVYFVPDRQHLGIDSMGEVAVSFELSGQFFDDEGKPAPYIQIARALEHAFHFSFGNAYKSKGRVFRRKPFNLTRALDYLKNLIIRTNKRQDEKR